MIRTSPSSFSSDPSSCNKKAIVSNVAIRSVVVQEEEAGTVRSGSGAGVGVLAQ